MRNKVIIVILVLLLIAVIGVVYYVKNVMIVRDKDGMVFIAEEQIVSTDDTYEKGVD